MLLFEKFERRKNPLFKQGKIPSNKLLCLLWIEE